MKSMKKWLPAVLLLALCVFAVIGGPRLAERIAYAVAQGENQAGREQLASLAKGETSVLRFSTGCWARAGKAGIG